MVGNGVSEEEGGVEKRGEEVYKEFCQLDSLSPD